MKRIISLILIFSALFALVSCGESEYPPVESTEVEKQSALILTVDGEEYTVKYELYRAFFLAYKDSVDGGDSSVWNGADKDAYIEEIESIIISKCSEIYSVLHHSKKIGIDVYSDEYNEIVEGFITASVEGGYYDEIFIEGFGGNYEAYLESLKKSYLNYSVQDLLFRYTLEQEAIYDYYAGTLDGEFLEEAQKGALEYTKEDVESFYYNSEECVRVLRIYRPMLYVEADRIAEIRESVANKALLGDDAVLDYIIGSSGTNTGIEEIKNGMVIGRYSDDRMYYEERTEIAFSLDVGEASEVIKLYTVSEEAYEILYRIAKNNAHFDECYDEIVEVYIQNEIGKILYDCSSKLCESAVRSSLLESLDRAGITMD